MSLIDKITQNKNDFEKIEKLYHYTSIETLKLIIESKSLKFNRNDKMNDLIEHRRNEFADFDYYITCFTHEDFESIPLWHIYAKREGVRITFPNKSLFKNKIYFMHNGNKQYFSYEVRGGGIEGPSYRNVFRVGDSIAEIGKPMGTIVAYDDTLLELNHTEKHGAGSYHISVTNVYQLAAVKSKVWSYEIESRFFITSHGNFRNFDSLFVELDDDVFIDFEVVFNPFISFDEYNSITEYMRTMYPNVKFKFERSSLTGKIK